MKKKLLLLIAMCILIFGSSMAVYASELNYPDIGERTNILEIKLEEYGITLSEIQNRLANTETNIAESELQRLELTQQLDVVIVGLNALLEETTLLHKELLEELKILPLSNKGITGIGTSVKEMVTLTVSGNTAISDLGNTVTDSIKFNSEQSLLEFNKTLADTNIMLVKLYSILLILIVVIIAAVIFSFLWKMLFRHAFDNIH